jgi:hypothetical protein
MLTGIAPVKPMLKLRFPSLATLEADSVICNWYMLGPELPGTMLIGPLFLNITPAGVLGNVLALIAIV